MKHKIFCLVSVFVLSAMLVLNLGYVQAQTPGQIPVFDQPATGFCNNAGGNDCVDSGIGADSGNIFIPDSTDTTGNIFKGGTLFLHNFGIENTFIGKNAGNLTLDPTVSRATRNTGVGESALSSLTTECCNTATGAGALSNNTGENNTASGTFALFRNTTGHDNTAIGLDALVKNTTGPRNTAVGSFALSSLTTGENNTAIGFGADVSVGNLTNATAIGAGAIVSQSDSLVLGNIFANVGIRNSSPHQPLTVGNVGASVPGGGGGFAIVGQSAVGAADATVPNPDQVAYVHAASNSGLFGLNAHDYATNTPLPISIGWSGSHNILLAREGGNVGIGTTAPGFKLDVAGAAHATSFPTSSDRRLKKTVQPLSNVLEKLEKIRGVTFDWNERYEALGRSTGRREIGVIAQEVEAVFPELVTTWGEEDYRAVDYGRLTGVLIEAVKEQQGEIRDLRSQNADLKARLEALERLMKTTQTAWSGSTE